MFTPRLKSFGIVSSGGVTNVETSFEALHKTVLFVHLSPTYKNKVWVRVDGGEREKGIIERLRTSYSGYPIDRFGQFSQEDFERYYLLNFRTRSQISLRFHQSVRKETQSVSSWRKQSNGCVLMGSGRGLHCSNRRRM